MIAVIDYGRGNMFSVAQALRHLGIGFESVSEPARLAGASSVVLPGVGAFGDAMAALRERGLVDPIRDCAHRGVPILGICLGMQVLADVGEEFGTHQGLGLVSGTVRRLSPSNDGPDRCRIPNVGWRRVECRNRQSTYADRIEGMMAYFNHSYTFEAAEPSAVLASIRINGRDVVAAVCRRNVVGFQFHPEKSGPAGLALLSLFLKLVDSAGDVAAAISARS